MENLKTLNKSENSSCSKVPGVAIQKNHISTTVTTHWSKNHSKTVQIWVLWSAAQIWLVLEDFLIQQTQIFFQFLYLWATWIFTNVKIFQFFKCWSNKQNLWDLNFFLKIPFYICKSPIITISIIENVIFYVFTTPQCWSSCKTNVKQFNLYSEDALVGWSKL